MEMLVQRATAIHQRATQVAQAVDIEALRAESADPGTAVASELTPYANVSVSDPSPSVHVDAQYTASAPAVAEPPASSPEPAPAPAPAYAPPAAAQPYQSPAYTPAPEPSPLITSPPEPARHPAPAPKPSAGRTWLIIAIGSILLGAIIAGVLLMSH